MSENDQYRIPNYAASEQTKLNSGDELRLRASTLDSVDLVDITRAAYEAATKANAQPGETLRTPSERLGGLGEVLRVVRAKEAGMDLENSDDVTDSVKFIHEAYRDSKKDAA